MMSPEGSVRGGGGGRDVRCDRRDKGCLTGGSRAAKASELDCNKGMRIAVSNGRRGVGSWRT